MSPVGLWFVTLWFSLCLFHSLFAISNDCRCGIVEYDPAYAKAVRVLYESIPYQFDKRLYFPTDAALYYPTEDYTKYYPYQGRIGWHVEDLFPCGCQLNLVGLGWEIGDPRLPLPTKRCILCRVGEFFDQNELAQSETRKFTLFRDYGAVIQAFHVLEADLVTYAESNIHFAEDRLQDIASGKDVSLRHSSLWNYCDEAKQLSEDKQKAEKSLKSDMERFALRKNEAFLACTTSLDNCIATHQSAFAYVNKGLFSYLDGDVIEALDYIKSAMDQSSKGDFTELSDRALLVKGQAELAADLYADAILSLTALIDRNPKNKEAYFERATAYFELEDFDQSLWDYLQSGIRPLMASDNSRIYEECLAATDGLVSGIGSGTIDYLPNLTDGVSALGKGISHAIWAFGQNPMKASVDFAKAVYQCGEFIVRQPVHAIEMLFPEVKELADSWDALDKTERIKKTSKIIGKYGTTICLDVATARVFTKAVQATNQLQKANTLLNLEALRLNPVSMQAKTAQVNYTVVAEWENALKKRVPTQANSVRGWEVGQDICNLTKEGKVPKWSTVRHRYWKNQAEKVKSSTNHGYTEEQIARMKKGLAPQRLNEKTGITETMELHHEPPQREGGLFDFTPLWPEGHAAIDPRRHLGGS